MDRGESLHELRPVGTSQLLKDRGAKHFGAHLGVEELRHQLAAGQQVGLGEERRLEQFQVLEQETCQDA